MEKQLNKDQRIFYFITVILLSVSAYFLYDISTKFKKVNIDTSFIKGNYDEVRKLSERIRDLQFEIVCLNKIVYHTYEDARSTVTRTGRINIPIPKTQLIPLCSSNRKLAVDFDVPWGRDVIPDGPGKTRYKEKSK